MSSNPGRKWPWIVVGSILGVVGLSYWTVRIAMNNPVQLSDLDMQDYHHFERDANKDIKAASAFNRKYSIEYVTKQFKADSATIKFKVTTKDGKPVTMADISLRITRPGTHAFDHDVNLSSKSEGVYTFETVTLPKEGRWDILSKFTVGKNYRYLNLKADTRYPNVFEY